MITTRQPTDDMIEVAIVSMEQALAADGEALPEGSGTLRRDTLDLAARPSGVRPGATEAEAAAPVSMDPPLPGA
jgi:hypothetical protein